MFTVLHRKVLVQQTVQWRNFHFHSLSSDFLMQHHEHGIWILCNDFSFRVQSPFYIPCPDSKKIWVWMDEVWEIISLKEHLIAKTVQMSAFSYMHDCSVRGDEHKLRYISRWMLISMYLAVHVYRTAFFNPQLWPVLTLVLTYAQVKESDQHGEIFGGIRVFAS